MAQPLIKVSVQQAHRFAVFLVLYEFLTYIANDMIMPAMINVVDTFHGTKASIADSLMLYVLGGASLQLILGPLSDRYGRRPVMVFGACFFFMCTVLIASSASMTQFMAARFFQGMGLCFITVVGYATLQEMFAEMDAVRLISIMANISTIAPLIGPLLGAIVIQYYGWRIIFVAIGVFALVALWGLWKYMPETVGQVKHDGEVIPQIRITPRTLLANYGALLSNRSFMFGSCALGLLSIPCLSWIGLAPVILVKNAKLTVVEYALWQLPLFGSTILGNVFLRWMTRRRSLNQLVMFGSAIAGVGLSGMLSLILLLGDDYLGLMPGNLVYFFSLGFVSAPLCRFILFSTEVAKGTASALMTILSMCAIGLGMKIANLIYENNQNLVLAEYFFAVGVVYLIAVLGLNLNNTNKSIEY